MKYTARQPGKNVNVTPSSPVREFFILTGGILGIIIGIYLILGFAVDLIVPHISTAFENRMAEHFIRSVSADDALDDSSPYVQALVDTMQKHCAQLPYRFTVHVRKGPKINALAFPGGHIIVYTGLLEKVTSENELAFVLAHEMGHYAHRDHLRGVGRAFVFMTVSALLFGPDSSVAAMLAHSLNITELSFSRDQEYHADEFAVHTLNSTYGHAAGAVDFFEKIPREHDPGTFGHYFASHPENRRRISRINDIIHTEGLKRGERTPLDAVLSSDADGTGDD